MQKLLQIKLRRRRAQTELATAIVIIVVLAVAALVAYWYIGTARSLTGRPNIRAGTTNTITAGGVVYICLYNDGPVNATITKAVVDVYSGGNKIASATFTPGTVPAGGSWCDSATTTVSGSLSGVAQVDAVITVTTTTGSTQIPTKLIVIGG
ncbi:hypothetical protein [Infirmifilum sp. SLHALR2]|nr:MAG: hypothetical protein B7L53_09745 [Thermofilum sp. NZ13]